MVPQLLPHIFSGPCFGDSPPSESSPTLPVGTESPTSSPLTLGPPLVDMEDLDNSCSNSGLNKIAERGHDASQEDQVIQCRLDALPSMSCQRGLPDFNGVQMTDEYSFEKSDSSDAEASLMPSQQNLVPCEQKTVPGLSRLRDGETQVNCALSRAEFSEPPLPEKCYTQSFESGHLTTNSSSLDPEISQTSHPGLVRSPASSTSLNNSALLSFSSSTMNADPRFSHRVDLEPCEQSTSSLVESFISTGGHSDDILPRPIFNGENEELKTDTNSRFSKDPKNHADTSISVMLNLSTTPETFHSNLSQNASHSSTQDPGTSITDFSLPLTGQIHQSHEETGTGCVSDHFNVPSSSSIAHTQSDPYFTPATIFRARSPDFRTDVVGLQELGSSSPPSSPSMTSNYMPSSSPIPSSSPMEGPNHTPPSSPSAVNERYIHDSSAEVQEPFYADETYPTFSHYSVDHRPYQSLDRHVSDNFYLSTPQHPSSISESLISPPFMQDYYDQVPEAPRPVEHYTRNDPTPLVTIEPFEPTPGPSNQLIETAPHTAETTPGNPKPRHALQKNVVPNPKRSTLAGVRLQQKKLSKPFRSPIVHPPVRLAPKPPTNSSEPLVSSANSAYLKETAAAAKSANAVASSSLQTSDTKIKHRTTRAASQFKSPLSSSSTMSDEAALVRLTPTIQSLERKLQLLRRALKVREDVQEEVLEGLVDKWSEAGREAAWEVWDRVKDNANPEDGGSNDKKGKKRAIEESWGWDDSGDQKKPKADEERERNWGWDVVPVSDRGGEDVQGEGDGEIAESPKEETNEDAPQPSLGTMLLQLGIAPETLGWDEDEGTFVEK